MPNFKKEGRGFKMKGFSPFTKLTDPPNGKKNKPVDDDTDKMTKKQQKQHMKKILEYNRTIAKPHPNPKNLMKKLELASKETRMQIDKLQGKGGLNEDEKAKLKDLKATYKDHQRMLHDMRRSPMKSLLNPEGADRTNYTFSGQDERPRVRRRNARRRAKGKL